MLDLREMMKDVVDIRAANELAGMMSAVTVGYRWCDTVTALGVLAHNLLLDTPDRGEALHFLCSLMASDQAYEDRVG